MNKKENKCSCGKNYEKAQKIIEEANENVKYRYIQGPQGLKGEIGPTGPQGEIGPTGPQGEQGKNGPTTIEVGITETSDPETEAIVTNVGTNKDVILNFKIPRGKQGEKGEQGETGPIGPIGPRGLPGEIGISQAITIDGTETLEPDEPAEVQDDFDSNIHHLTFYIPKGEKGEQGPVGPQGPQGPQGQMQSAYAIRYLDETQDLNLQTSAETTIPLNKEGPS